MCQLSHKATVSPSEAHTQSCAPAISEKKTFFKKLKRFMYSFRRKDSRTDSVISRCSKLFLYFLRIILDADDALF